MNFITHISLKLISLVDFIEYTILNCIRLVCLLIIVLVKLCIIPLWIELINTNRNSYIKWNNTILTSLSSDYMIIVIVIYFI